ncbi:hypothetical protein CAPTEDRAFT_189613 [Capitella teleta]|uniref:Uncharacterized protein n=1 Tax=Capitella teleta TaxID=283909 RepID=R7UBD4_CAPTE|nr:hypothetical protein CAPTEDRAFT_189613 [Capitella teleta]|eukprot:ELU03299.1 hypothetical protein CAPTEDRAFT_189613 [Capitella teleta]
MALITYLRVFSPNDLAVANGLWLNAHVGVGARLYTSKHMKNMCTSKRVVYTAFGTVMFNFGSVLFWATSKKLLPKCKTFTMLFGLASGVALLAIGEMYLREIDSKTQTAEETSEE